MNDAMGSHELLESVEHAHPVVQRSVGVTLALFAACLAAHKGLDPDKPRTLTKVTLTL